jgi:hypothetical protein
MNGEMLRSRPASLVLTIVLAILASGCGRPSGECEITSELTESDCSNAIEAALPKLPNDRAATKLTVLSGCPRAIPCLPPTNALVVTVEVTFKGSDRIGVIAVRRGTWEASEFRYLPPPSTP